MELSTLNNLPEEFREIAQVLQLNEQALGDYSVKAVELDSLIEALGIKTRRTDWLKAKLSKLNLKRGEDYEILLPNEGKQTGSGGHNKKSAVFTIEAAKMIAMISQSEQGDLVRRYFLFMERQAQAAMRGESVQIITPPKQEETVKQKALRELVSESEYYAVFLKHCGLDTMAVRSQLTELAIMKEAEHNVTILTPDMRPALLPGQEVAKHGAVSVAATETGHTRAVKPSKLAQILGVKPKHINIALVRLGFQYKIVGTNEYGPKPDGVKYCYASKRVKTGIEVVTGWNESLLLPHLEREINIMTHTGVI